LKLFGDKGPITSRILIVAKYNGVNIETPKFDVSVDNKSADFLTKSPVGKVPVLDTPEGSLFEANAIARYVAKLGKGLITGSSPFETGQIDQWIDFAAMEIELPGNVWVFPILGYIPNNPTATQKAKGDIRKVLEVINKFLANRTFLVGNRLSLADIVVVTALLPLYQRVLDIGFRKSFVNANRWFLTCLNQPEFLAVLGEVKLCEKMEVAPQAAVAPAVKEDKPKPETAKQAPQPQQAKPKPKPKPEDEDDDDTGEKAEAKKPNPLDSLPPSKFNLEDWKRLYSNEDTRSVAIPWFWEQFDKEGFSIWVGDYKYSDELVKLMNTCNLLGGFIQRLEKLRKYGFGSMCIFGEEPKLDIGICFIFRGQDVPAEMTECEDSVLYRWRKADLNSTSDRELINDYWAWNGNFGDGKKKFNQAKAFK